MFFLMTSLKLDIPCAVIAGSVAEGLTAALCAPCLLRVLGSNGMRCGFVKGPERGALGVSRRCKGISVSLARFMVIIQFARYCRPTRSRLVSALRRKEKTRYFLSSGSVLEVPMSMAGGTACV